MCVCVVSHVFHLICVVYFISIGFGCFLFGADFRAYRDSNLHMARVAMVASQRRWQLWQQCRGVVGDVGGGRELSVAIKLMRPKVEQKLKIKRAQIEKVSGK